MDINNVSKQIWDFKLKIIELSAVIEKKNDISANQQLMKCYGIKEFAQNEYVKENIEFEKIFSQSIKHRLNQYEPF